MGTKPKVREATPDEVLTALTLEARRRGLKSYGELQQQTNLADRQEIVDSYIAQKDAKKKREEMCCDGCVYNVRNPTYTGNRMCRFNKRNRVRRKDDEGNCLEFTPGRKPSHRAVKQDVPHDTIERRLMNGDWSDKTISEIAAVFGVRDTSVYNAIYKIKRKYGQTVSYVVKRRNRDYG